jgi:hypothetical protein
MEIIRLQGRTLSEDDLKAVRALLAGPAPGNRTALSVRLCELWNRSNGTGHLKDMTARTFLLKLEARAEPVLLIPKCPNSRPLSHERGFDAGEFSVLRATGLSSVKMEVRFCPRNRRLEGSRWY